MPRDINSTSNTPKVFASSSSPLQHLRSFHIQTTATVLVMRYSRKVNEVGKDLYIGTTMTLMAELMKFILCLLVLALLESCSIAKSLLIFYFEVLKKPNETIKLLIPSSLYTIQNNLVITALSNLDAPTFQISYQIKIITTAVFSVLVLRKHINCMQWLALLILMLGVVFVQVKSLSWYPEGQSNI